MASARGCLCSQGNPFLLDLTRNISSPAGQPSATCFWATGPTWKWVFRGLGFSRIPAPRPMESIPTAREEAKRGTEVAGKPSAGKPVTGGQLHLNECQGQQRSRRCGRVGAGSLIFFEIEPVKSLLLLSIPSTCLSKQVLSHL